jgi:NFU1 iron-sulfur cluster scaffold homolog, mitochondrial
VTDLAGQVAAALQRSVLPAVIARGAALQVVSVHDGVATLAVTGSPGAVVPLAARIEAHVRAAVPGITEVQIHAPSAQPLSASAQPSPASGGGLAEQARHILDTEINPAVAAHRGHIVVDGVDRGLVRIRLEGGCQGCSLAEVTVRQGIEPLLRARLPGVTGVVDVTDHEAGTQPFFSPEKR